MRRSPHSMAMAASGSVMTPSSVISRVSAPGGTPARAIRSATRSTRAGSIRLRTDRFTARPRDRPCRRHRRAWSRADSRTNWPRGWMRAVDSAMGMNSSGGTWPCTGWSQRTRASAPTTRPPTSSTWAGSAGQVALLDGDPQGPDQGEPPRAVLVPFRGVDLDVGVAALGLVHGDVGALQEQLRILAMVRSEGDPDAAGDLQLELLDGQGPSQGPPDQLADGDGGVPVGQDRDEHGELVAAEPGHDVAVRQPGPEPDTDLPEDEVAAGVPEGVVDLLEAVQVDEQNGEAAVGPEGGGRLAHPVGEQRPVGKPGERVVEGLVLAFGGRTLEVVEELAAGQGDPGLAGEGPEQGEVLVAEGTDGPKVVGDQQRPGHLGPGPHGGENGVPDAPGGQRLAHRRVSGRGGEPDRLVGRDHPPQNLQG